MTEPKRSSRLTRAVVLAVLIVVGLGCLRLGVWQLDRLQQRRERNALIVGRMNLPAVPLAEALASPEDPAYRNVYATGRFDPVYAFYLANRTHDDLPGVHVVAPFREEESSAAVLVNLGWIAVEDAGQAEPSAWIPEGSLDVEGILRTSQVEPRFSWLADPTAVPGDAPRRSWRVLAIDRIQAEIPYPLAPTYLALTAPVPGDRPPLPAPDLDLSDGPHLSYAIQWFAFGATAIIGGIAWFRSTRRKTP
ncbi:MAG TPA: SURF1 family protein [Anaerolineales bacterium]|nr:SURF1 family protein [Anaerolineales bacterium]